jgi:hypothetical protein
MKKVISVLIAGLAVAIAYRSLSGCLPPSQATLDCDAIVSQGQPIVSSIYRFREETGLWPYTLAEAMGRDKAININAWKYYWEPSGHWHLTNYFDYPNLAVRYEVRPGHQGWFLTDGIDSRELHTKPERLANNHSTALKVKAAILCRIRERPNLIVHYKGYYSWCVEHKELQEAIAIGKAAIKRFPNYWWGYYAVALVERENPGDGEKALVTFLRRKGDCPHSFLLAHYYHLMKKEKERNEVLDEIPHKPVKDLDAPVDEAGDENGLRADYFLWHSCFLAYKANLRTVVLDICTSWEKYWQDNLRCCDRSFFAFRAAVLVKSHRFCAAQRELNMCKGGQAIWADNLETLEAAVSHNDAAFEYDPGRFPGPIPITMKYE